MVNQHVDGQGEGCTGNRAVYRCFGHGDCVPDAGLGHVHDLFGPRVKALAWAGQFDLGHDLAGVVARVGEDGADRCLQRFDQDAVGGPLLNQLS